MRMHTETTTMNKTPTTESDSVRQRLRDVALYGLAAQDDALLAEPWVERVIDIEDRERKRRSLERRLANARIGAFKPIADFDWAWPKRTDRPLIEELFSLAFVDDATNVVLVGPNGVGKTMLCEEPPPPRRPQRLHRPIHHRLRHAPRTRRPGTPTPPSPGVCVASPGPQLLAIDEVGYLNYDNRYADLLFEVVTRRYLTSPVLITTNKPFSEWGDVFSSAACVVTKRARASERNPRRPTHPSLGNRPTRRRKLSAPRGQGASRQTLQGPFAPHRQIPCIVRTAPMNHQPPPLITVPLDLSDEAAARLIDFLLEIAHRMENHYSEQLYRYHNAIDERQPDLWSDTDPPF